MRVGSLGQEDDLEEEMATQSSILACKIPRTEEPCGLQSMVSQRVRHDSYLFICVDLFLEIHTSTKYCVFFFTPSILELLINLHIQN